MALDVIADQTWDDVDKAWDSFTYETWDGWIEFSYALKIYDTSAVKVAEITGDLKNPTLTSLEFETLQQGGCGAFSFTLAEPYTQATITYDYKIELYIFNPQVLFYTGKIINKPIEGTEKPQTYSGWGYFNELEKKIIDTEISPGSDIAVEVTSVLDTHITPYTSILKDATLIETVSHDLVATIDFEDEYANEIFKRLTELAVDYKFGVNEDRNFYFQAIDTSVNYYWHVGKHLSEFHPEEDPSEIVKKVIAVYPEVFTDGYRLKVTSEAVGYADLYDKRFSLPEIVNPFSTTDRATGTPSTNPAGTGAANLCDNDNSTLWESGTNQASGHYIKVDLGASYENIAAVVIDSIHANAQEYNAKSIKIEISSDDSTYVTMLSSDDDIGWKPTLTFRPTTGRYVKISLTGSSSEEWKVGEVEIYQLDLTDAQRWADWKLSTLEDVKKRATARIDNIQSMIMDWTGLVPIKPVGKARIFDRNGTKIDDYQVIACRYSLSSGGFALDLELGAEEITIADRDKEWQRRIRELENSGVRRAKNLSLSKGFQLSKITGTYIGPDAIQTKHLAAHSVLAGEIAVVGIDANGQLVLSQVGSGDFDNIPEGTTYQRVLATALTSGEVNLSNAGVINKTAANIAETAGLKWAAETGATLDQTGAEIKTAYQAEANAYTDTKNTKLGGVEALADVTSTHTAADTALVNTVAAATVQGNATDGKTAHTGTVLYRTTGVPTNNPTPTTVSKLVRANGSMDIKLGWDTYTQGASQADLILLFWEKSTEAADKIWDEIEETWDDVVVGEETWDGTSLGAPAVTDSCIAFNVNTVAASYFFLEGCNPNSCWSFGVAAARRTENGLEIGAIQSPTTTPDWQDVTGDSPNYVGNVHGVPAVNIQEWADDPAARINVKATLILPGKLYLNWETGRIEIGHDALGTDKPGMVIKDANDVSRAELGKLNGDYGATFRDADGVERISLGAPQGIWTRILSTTIAGAAVASFDLSGLDGNADLEYLILCRWVGGIAGRTGFGIRPNNDDGAAAYGFQTSFAQGNNVNVTGWRDTDYNNMWIGDTEGLDHVSQGTIRMFAKSGFERIAIGQMSRNVTGTTINSLYGLSTVWNNTADNITSLRFYGHEGADTIGIGTHVEVWKRTPQA